MQVQERVDLGASLLNINRENWRKEINRHTLRMEDFHSCVLAQLYGDYYAGLVALGLSDSMAVVYGFDVDPNEDPDELTAVWLEVL